MISSVQVSKSVKTKQSDMEESPTGLNSRRNEGLQGDMVLFSGSQTAKIGVISSYIKSDI